jgi:hypothetical protein
MPNTYKLISSVTVGSGGASSIDFTDIPQTYTDLKIVTSTRAPGVDNQIRFNGVSANRSSRFLYSTGGGVSGSQDNADIQLQGSSATSYSANTFGMHEIYISNYASSQNKPVSITSCAENNNVTGFTFLGTGLWQNSAAITSISIYNSSGNYVQHSTAYLYGVSNVNVGTVTTSPYATGGTVTSNGQYYIHTFTSDGTFTPNQTLSCEYLVIAGGGAGGNSVFGQANSGGGGAGGYRTGILSVTSGAKTVTVGAGGASGSNANGSNSVFDSITATGGGRGGAAGSKTGQSGGSGGGGADVSSGGAGTGGQGNNGGAGVGTSGGYPCWWWWWCWFWWR